MRPIIFVTRRIPQPALDRLADIFEVRLNTEDRALTPPELIAGTSDADALLCLLTDRVDSVVMDASPHLKCISNYAVGYNNIDTEYAASRGIAVCNTPGVLTESTADLAWALLMACARRIVESDRYVRKGKFVGWEPMLMLGQDVHRKTLGIIGMGRIGQAMARRARGFDMRVLFFDPAVSAESMESHGYRVDLETLLRQSDYISLHTPLTPETDHLLGHAELAMMKAGAILINTARGPIVDENALIQSLKKGQLASAGFDVYEFEPHIPAELLALPNVVVLPHIGSASIETRTAMGMLAAENAIAVIQGREAPARVC